MGEESNMFPSVYNFQTLFNVSKLNHSHVLYIKGIWVVFRPIMCSNWEVLYQILIHTEWVRIGWFCLGCIICNKVMWSSICFVYLLQKWTSLLWLHICILTGAFRSLMKFNQMLPIIA